MLSPLTYLDIMNIKLDFKSTDLPISGKAYIFLKLLFLKTPFFFNFKQCRSTTSMSCVMVVLELESFRSKDVGLCGVDVVCFCLVLETRYHKIFQVHRISLNNVDC